jgi:hypothetical protein
VIGGPTIRAALDSSASLVGSKGMGLRVLRNRVRVVVVDVLQSSSLHILSE